MEIHSKIMEMSIILIYAFLYESQVCNVFVASKIAFVRLNILNTELKHTAFQWPCHYVCLFVYNLIANMLFCNQKIFCCHSLLSYPQTVKKILDLPQLASHK